MDEASEIGKAEWIVPLRRRGVKKVPMYNMKEPEPLDANDDRLFDFDYVFGLEDNSSGTTIKTVDIADSNGRSDNVYKKFKDREEFSKVLSECKTRKAIEKQSSGKQKKSKKDKKEKEKKKKHKKRENE